MSRTETAIINLKPLTQAEVDKLLVALQLLDDYEESDYLHEQGIQMLGDWWYHVQVESLDECGFVKVLDLDEEGVPSRIIAQWYNGGASLGEIIESAFEENK